MQTILNIRVDQRNSRHQINLKNFSALANAILLKLNGKGTLCFA